MSLIAFIIIIVMILGLNARINGVRDSLQNLNENLRKLTGKLDKLDGLERPDKRQDDAPAWQPDAHAAPSTQWPETMPEPYAAILTPPASAPGDIRVSAPEPAMGADVGARLAPGMPDMPNAPETQPLPPFSSPPPLSTLLASSASLASLADPSDAPPTAVLKDAVRPDDKAARRAAPPGAAWQEDKAKLLLKLRTSRLTTWLIAEGNIWVTIGVLLFLAGFGLLFNYAIQRNWISMETRILMGSAVGIAMTGIGWRIRSARRAYALILQGGGIAVLYVVLLAGARFGPVIPPAGAVVGMIMLSAFSIALAVPQDFEPLAVFALLGGYMAPILVSTGSSNFVALFSIYSLLNFEILLISAARDWRKTRWGGLAASVAVGSLWGILRWRDEYFTSVEPFLALFFINYSAISLVPLFRERLAKFFSTFSAFGKPRGGEFARADTPMIMTLPFVFLFLQMAAAGHTAYGVAVTCLALGAWYIALAYCLMRRGETAESIGVTPRLFLIYCLLFSNLAVPFIFRQALSSCVWAIEGTLLAAYAAKNKKTGLLLCGILLHAFAFLLYNFAPYMHLPAHLYAGALPSVALRHWRDGDPYFLLTSVIFAMSGYAASYFADVLRRSETDAMYFSLRRSSLCDALSWALAVYGTAWWTMAAYHAADFTLGGTRVSALMILGIGAIAAYEVSDRANWKQIRVAAIPPFAIMLRPALIGSAGRNYALDWLVSALMSARVFISYRGKEADNIRRVTWGAALFIAIGYTSSVWAGFAREHFDSAHALSYSGIIYLARYLPVFIAAIPLLHRRFGRSVKMGDYKLPSMIAIAALMLANLWYFIISCGRVEEYAAFYIPLINPLELWQALYMATAGIILYEMKYERVRRVGLYFVLPVAVFLWLNSVAARSAWMYFDESLAFGSIARKPYFQGIIAILWGFTALVLIYFGKRNPDRFLWFTGAALLAADIAKLLLVDLRNSATVVRILAFLMLGGLFLLIGWIAPLPPKREIGLPHKPDEKAGQSQ